ncbi:hypothetical protein [Crossiella sp. NPDC003009]
MAAVSGHTELEIMRESLRLNGIDPTATAVAKLGQALVTGYHQARDELRSVGRALPGARQALVTFAAEPAVQQSVLTGNLREVARIKLAVFGLDTLVDLASGAYGDDHHDRAELVRIARRGRVREWSRWRPAAAACANSAPLGQKWC